MLSFCHLSRLQYFHTALKWVTNSSKHLSPCQRTEQNTVANAVHLTSGRSLYICENHKLVVSVCQKASGSLPKDLSKNNLDPRCSKRGATDGLRLYVRILSEAAFADNKNPGLVDLWQWTKAARCRPAPWRVSCFFPQLPKSPPDLLAGCGLHSKASPPALQLLRWLGNVLIRRRRASWIMSIKSWDIRRERASSLEETAELMAFCFSPFHETNRSSLWPTFD